MSPIEKEFLERLQYAVMQAFPTEMLVDVDTSSEYMAGMTVARLRASVYGRNGQKASTEHRYVEANLPRYIPKWLRERWTTKRVVTLDVTPYVLYPDLKFVLPPDQFGEPQRTLEVHAYDREEPS